MRLWKPILRGDCELDDMHTVLDQREFKHAQDYSQHRKPLSLAGLQRLDVQRHQIRVRDVFFVGLPPWQQRLIFLQNSFIESIAGPEQCDAIKLDRCSLSGLARMTAWSWTLRYPKTYHQDLQKKACALRCGHGLFQREPRDISQ